MYDLIGDIHGHADELENLLRHLGYNDTPTGFCHPERKVIFLGDFIDRGEHLVQHRRLLDVVMKMVRSEHALAVMGNHEFNALAYHTEHKGEFLRLHTEKNRKQHQAFLNEFEHDPDAKKEVLEFFFELPLWLELDEFRVVHACWCQESIDFLRGLEGSPYLTRDLLVKASTEGSREFTAVETLLKGYEIELPKGIYFQDKDGNRREWMRVQWWKDEPKHLREIALPFGIDIGQAGQLPIPEGVPRYPKDEKPCFIGHYWQSGEPRTLSVNVACLDYSIAKGGRLMAYRWLGESELVKEHFCSAP